MERYCTNFIEQDLQKKMVFIGGPRQVGKTVLSLNLCKKYNGEYLNWDIDEDRGRIRHKQWPIDKKIVIFDELHKYPRWKQWVKGVYDGKPDDQNYLVTGSARLDVYRRGGDSLMGRYHYWRLHPITLDELPTSISAQQAYQRLLTIGGFPEPFLQDDAREAKRWRRERFDRIIQEDIRNLEPIRNIQLLQLFIDACRKRVGSLIVLSNLAEDLQISPKTAKAWLAILERMYMAFAVYPLTQNIPRAIHKPPKVYFYDNADAVDNPACRLENLVATTLLKRLQFIEDYYGSRCQLHYIRDKDNREVGFATVIDGKLDELIEVKLNDSKVSKNLRYYAQKLQPNRAIQIVGNLNRRFDDNGIAVLNPIDYCQNPPWNIGKE